MAAAFDLNQSSFKEEEFNLKVQQILIDAKTSNLDWKSQEGEETLRKIAEALDEPFNEDDDEEERKQIEKDPGSFFLTCGLPVRDEIHPKIQKFNLKYTEKKEKDKGAKENETPPKVIESSEKDTESEGEEDAVYKTPLTYFKQGIYTTAMELPERLKSHPLLAGIKKVTVESLYRTQILIEQFHRREFRRLIKRKTDAEVVYHANMARNYASKGDQSEAFKKRRENNTNAARKSRAKNKNEEFLLSDEMKTVFAKRNQLLEKLAVLNSYDGLLRNHFNTPTIDWLGNEITKKTFRWNIHYSPNSNYRGVPK